MTTLNGDRGSSPLWVVPPDGVRGRPGLLMVGYRGFVRFV